MLVWNDSFDVELSRRPPGGCNATVKGAPLSSMPFDRHGKKYLNFPIILHVNLGETDSFFWEIEGKRKAPFSL